jgi:DNA-binding NarL/FixJ family response regulator
VVRAGRRLVPPEVAERLSEYFPKVVLTPREVEVLTCVANGLSNKEIAQRLGAASGTIKMHVQHILSKLAVADRTHAVTVAIQRGIISI